MCDGFVEQVLVEAQIPEKEKGATAFVAIGERVIFDDEVEQMSGAAGYVRIKEVVAKALLDGGNGRGEAVAAHLGKECGCLAFGDKRGFEVGQRGKHVIEGERAHSVLAGAGSGEALRIVAL